MYQPIVTAAEEVPESSFEAAEQLEFTQSNLAGAAVAYRRLAESSKPALRAAALVRLGRVLRKSGNRAGALDAYSRLLHEGNVEVAGQPAELVARQGRCRTLEEAHNSEALGKEVAELARALYSTTWRMDRATFKLYRDMTLRWGGPPPPKEAIASTEAAIVLWRAWRAGDSAPRGRRILHEAGTPVLAVWAGGSDRVTAWLATPHELEGWLSPLLHGQHLALWLQDTQGLPFSVRGCPVVSRSLLQRGACRS